MVYCGTFTASGLQVAVSQGKLFINKEGAQQKFVQEVDQITFSGDYSLEKDQKVLYITERAVFELKSEGLTLIEVAPGVDMERDIFSQIGFQPMVSNDIKLMDGRIFEEELLGFDAQMAQTAGE